MIYDAHQWYWLADDGRVFAAASETEITAADPTYAAWAAVNRANPWPRDAAGVQSDAALQEVLGQYSMFANLAYYAANARYNHASGGIMVTSLAGNGVFLTDPVSRNTINSAYDYALANAGATFQWKLADGSFIALDKNKITTLSNDVAGFVQACFTCESQQVAGIGNGTVTSRAQIDAAFAAIANVFA